MWRKHAIFTISSDFSFSFPCGGFEAANINVATAYSNFKSLNHAGIRYLLVTPMKRKPVRSWQMRVTNFGLESLGCPCLLYRLLKIFPLRRRRAI